MKKLLVVAMLAMCCIACHSQECPYKFLGIPIEGTMDEFAKKLEEKGFKKNYYSPSKEERDLGFYNYCFTGKFFGEECQIILSSFSNSNIIAFVDVRIYNEHTLITYKDLRTALAKRYSDKNKWYLDTKGDIGDLSDYQIRQMISENAYFLFRVVDLKVDRPYINLAIDYFKAEITYFNSSRVAKIEGEKDSKKALDL